MAPLHQARFFAQLKNLKEEPFQRLQMPLAKSRNGIVIRMLIPRKKAEGHVFKRRELNPAGRENPRTLTVDQQASHNF